jgi:hypothetical protein
MLEEKEVEMSNQKVIEALERSLNCASEPELRAQLAAAIRRLRAPVVRLSPQRRSAATLRGDRHASSAKGTVGRHMSDKEKSRRSSRAKI